MPQEGRWLLAGKSGARLSPRVAAPSRLGEAPVQAPPGLLRTAGGLRLGAGGDPQPGPREGRRACPGITRSRRMGTAPHIPTPQCFLAPGAS